MNIMQAVSGLVIPLLLITVITGASRKKADVFSAFSQGVKESLEMICNIFPSVFTLMTAISILRASGLLDFIISVLAPLAKIVGIPPAIIPQALLRPLSGSGSLALLSDILKNHGPDTLTGITASVLSGSTETTFYTLAVYFGGSEIKNSRYALKAALTADLASIAASIMICRILF